MEFSIKSGSPEKQRSACVVIGVFEPRKLSVPGEIIDKAAHGHISDLLRRGDMEGKAGTTLLLHNVPGTHADRVLLVGLGKEKEFREKEYRDAIATAVRTLNETGAFDGTIYLTELPVKKRDVAWRIRQAALVALETLYRFDRFKSKKDEVRRPLRKLTLCVESRTELAAAETALAQGLAIAAGMSLAKDLGNLPGNVCTPTYLAEQATGAAPAESASRSRCWSVPTWKSSAWASLLSVARGSHQPPKFIVLRHNGGKTGRKADGAGRQGTTMFLVVRSSVDPLSLVSALRKQVADLDPSVPLYNVQTMDEVAAAQVASQRFNAAALAAFAGLAVLLAAVGIYGVMAYAVGQRTWEIGVRMALGAEPADVLRMVLRQGLGLALVGIVLGLGASFALTRLMRTLLFGVQATDPATFVIVTMAFVGVALAACWIPARRATRVDPVVALRYE